MDDSKLDFITDDGDLVIQEWLSELNDKGLLSEEELTDEILNLVQRADNEGAYQVFRGERTLRKSLLKVSTLTFQELSTLVIAPGNSELVIIAAEEVKFDTDQIRVSLRLEKVPAKLGLTPNPWPKLGRRSRPSGRKHGPSGKHGEPGRKGGEGETPDGLTIVFIFGSISTRSGTVDPEAVDANFLFNGSNGGNGSGGGDGQDGQAGAHGRKASFRGVKCRRGAGDGGNGGNGGRAGDGGDGGDGAPGTDIIFYGPNDLLEIAKLFNISNIGGHWGIGGSPGDRGRGAFPGSPGRHKPSCGRGSRGAFGRDGAPGEIGDKGERGEDGELQYLDDSERPVSSLF